MHDTVHIPVLFNEVLEWSNASPGKVFVDGTLGGAGHSLLLLERIFPNGKLIGIDRDPRAIERARRRLQEKSQELQTASGDQPKEDRDWFLLQGSYIDIPDRLQELGIEHVDGILLDLGLSSDQLEDRERGFSFREDSPLDLRFDDRSGWTAADLLQHWPEKEIAGAIYQYGEERFSRRIAKAIVEQRRTSPITTTKQLADLVRRCVPGPNHGRIDKATRTFQALRIAVNQELEHLEQALKTLPRCLGPEGRFLIISFHSLEDRPVKHAFREHELLSNLTKKPIVASDQETHQNPRSRSAKLRVAKRKAS